MRMAASVGIRLALLGCLGCDGSGGAVERFDFSTDNLEYCTEMAVTVDLAAAGATLMLTEDGAADCTPAAVLDQAGCSFSFDTTDPEVLVVTIRNCRDFGLGVGSLFDCAFDHADRQRLSNAAMAHCACTVDCRTQINTCYSDPALCVADVKAPRSCEHCFNGNDDDSNGMIDCDDPICWASCGVGATGTTCTLSTTSTTSTSSPASTVTTTLQH